jgi:tetratricopeptide (TPR) repeat protein
VAAQPESPNVTTPGYGMPPPAQPGPSAAPQPLPAQGAQPQYGQPSPAPTYPSPTGGYPAPTYGQPGYTQPPPQGYAQPVPPPQPYAPQAYPAQPGYGPYGQPSPPPAAQPSAAVGAAAQRYRAALSLYIQRDYLGAIAELDAAITLDPNLAVAYTARGSSKFGLGKFREAAADYKAALDLDATRAEPIWGLAECQRMLKDPAAPDTYRRYASSVSGDVNEDRRSKARRWATELSGQR